MDNKTQDYENLSYRLQLRRACKRALVVLIICFVVIAPALWCWEQSVTKRQTLREAKNVVRNTNLLAIESYGFGDPIMSDSRKSGMSKSAEERVKSYSGADGEIYLISWNTGKNCVTTMNYQKGRWLIAYTYDSKKELETYDIYWNIHQYYK